MTLANAFTVAWKDLKTGAAKVADFLTKNSTNIHTVVSEVGTVVSAIDPALAPEVTVFDLLEEQVIGKVLELANDAENANSLAVVIRLCVAGDHIVEAATLESPGGKGRDDPLHSERQLARPAPIRAGRAAFFWT